MVPASLLHEKRSLSMQISSDVKKHEGTKFSDTSSFQTNAESFFPPAHFLFHGKKRLVKTGGFVYFLLIVIKLKLIDQIRIML